MTPSLTFQWESIIEHGHIRHKIWIPEIEFYQKGNIEEETEEDTELDEIQNNNIEHTDKQNKMNSV